MTYFLCFCIGVIVGVFGLLIIAFWHDHNNHNNPSSPPYDDYDGPDPFDDFD